MHSLGDRGCCTLAKTPNQPCCFQCNFWRKKCRMVQWTSASGMSIGIVWAAGYIQQYPTVNPTSYHNIFAVTDHSVHYLSISLQKCVTTQIYSDTHNIFFCYVCSRELQSLRVLLYSTSKIELFDGLLYNLLCRTWKFC